MRSTKLAFDLDYLMSKGMLDREERMFNAITCDYEFRCTNYAVAYTFSKFLEKLKWCESSAILDDCYSPFNVLTNPYDWVIFFTCRPQDMLRMKYVAHRIPSSIKANIRILNEEEELV